MRVQDFRIGWICALGDELTAARAVLDETYSPLTNTPEGDDNDYTLGRIGQHDIVIVCLPIGRYGNASAANVATNLKRTFPRLTLGILVGIGGGVPTPLHDIRLGDVVVAVPQKTCSGVIQYEMGKRTSSSLQRKGSLPFPPMKFLSAVHALKSQFDSGPEQLEALLELIDKASSTGPATNMCSGVAQSPDIFTRRGKPVERSPRATRAPVIHYGLVGSGDWVMTDELERDRLNTQDGIICFEMEAAGVLNSMPCLVVRGISDYANSLKSDGWHGLAALAAASYAKLLLLRVVSDHPSRSLANLQNCTPNMIAKTRLPHAIGHYIGRTSELAAIRQWVDEKQAGRSQQKAAVITGIAGLGKTQLGLKLANSLRDKFPQILWLDGSTEASLISGIRTVFSSNDLETDRASTATLMSHPALEQSMVMIDNVDLDWRASKPPTGAYDIEQYLPISGTCAVVVTSQLSSWPTTFTVVRLEPLQHSEARSLFEEQAEQHFTDDRELKSLLTSLDGLPLALSLAGSFIRETGCSPALYMKRYRESWASMLQLQEEFRLQEYNKSLLVAWSLSFKQLEQNDANAYFLFQLCSLLSNQNLSFGLFKSSVKTLDIAGQGTIDAIECPTRAGHDPSPHSVQCYAALSHDELGFRAALRTLSRLSMISMNQSTPEDARFSIHPMLQRACFSATFESEEVLQHDHQLDLVYWSHRLLTPHAGCETSYSSLSEHRFLHLVALTSRMKYLKRTTDFISILADRKLVQVLLDGNQLHEARQMVLVLLEQFETPDHPSAAEHSSRQSLLVSLGRIYERQGLTEEALQTYEKALGSDPTKWHPQISDDFEVLESFGCLYNAKGHHQEADKILTSALKTRKNLDQDYASILDNVELQARGMPDAINSRLRMIELLEQVWEGRMENHGLKSPSTIRAACQLGAAYLKFDFKDNRSGAGNCTITCLSLMETTCKASKEHLGFHHHLTLEASLLYYGALLKESDYAAALLVAREALQMSAIQPDEDLALARGTAHTILHIWADSTPLVGPKFTEELLRMVFDESQLICERTIKDTTTILEQFRSVERHDLVWRWKIKLVELEETDKRFDAALRFSIAREAEMFAHFVIVPIVLLPFTLPIYAEAFEKHSTHAVLRICHAYVATSNFSMAARTLSQLLSFADAHAKALQSEVWTSLQNIATEEKISSSQIISKIARFYTQSMIFGSRSSLELGIEEFVLEHCYKHCNPSSIETNTMADVVLSYAIAQLSQGQGDRAEKLLITLLNRQVPPKLDHISVRDLITATFDKATEHLAIAVYTWLNKKQGPHRTLRQMLQEAQVVRYQEYGSKENEFSLPVKSLDGLLLVPYEGVTVAKKQETSILDVKDQNSSAVRLDPTSSHSPQPPSHKPAESEAAARSESLRAGAPASPAEPELSIDRSWSPSQNEVAETVERGKGTRAKLRSWISKGKWKVGESSSAARST